MTYRAGLAPKNYSDAYIFQELQKLQQELDYLRGLAGNLGTEQGYVWDDYVTSGLAVAGGNAPPSLAAFRGNIKLYSFPGTGVQTKDVFATTHILHGIRPNSDMSLHVHWATSTTATAGSTVVWQAEYTIARGYGAGVYGDPLTAVASTAYGVMTCTSTAAVSPFTHIIGGDSGDFVLPAQTELEVDSVILLRLYRDPTHVADTCSQDAFLIQLDWHYQRDRLGTVEKNRPFGSWR